MMRTPRARTASADGARRRVALRSTTAATATPGVEQIERRLVAEAVRRGDDGARAGLHAVEPHQALRRVGEHDARAVVVAEDERLIEGAGGDHRLLAADLVEAGCRATADAQLSANMPVTAVSVMMRRLGVAPCALHEARRAARLTLARSPPSRP